MLLTPRGYFTRCLSIAGAVLLLGYGLIFLLHIAILISVLTAILYVLGWAKKLLLPSRHTKKDCINASGRIIEIDKWQVL